MSRIRQLQSRMRLSFMYMGLTPRPPQKKFIDNVAKYDAEGAILAWPMRTGKTAVACALAYARQGNVVALCPKQVIPTWEQSLTDARVGDFKVYSYGQAHHAWWDYASIDTLILDEIHCIRSKGKKTKTLSSVVKLASLTKYCLGLSGTIMDIDPYELFYICKVVALDNILNEPNRSKFYANRCVDISRSAKFPAWRMRQGHLGPFKRAFMKYTDHCEMSGRPPKTMVVEYGLGPRIVDLQAKILKGGALGIPGFKMPPEGWSKAIRNQKWLQLTSGFLLDEEATAFTVLIHRYNQKFEKLREVLLSDDTDTVLYYRYRFEEKILREITEELGIDTYGVDNWEEGEVSKERKALILHPLNGGVGLNLSSYGQIIYVTESTSGILAAQSKERLSVYGENCEEKRILYLLPQSGYGKTLRKLLEEKEKSVINFFKEKEA